MSAMPWVHSDDAASARVCGGHEYAEALKVLELLDAAAEPCETADAAAGTAAGKAAGATTEGIPQQPPEKRLRTVRRLKSNQ